MTLRAALIDANGVFLRMDELADPREMTARHLPQITDCDLPSGKYKWVPDPMNPYGGAFWDLAWLKRVEDDRAAVLAAQEKEQRIAARRAARRRQRGEA